MAERKGEDNIPDNRNTIIDPLMPHRFSVSETLRARREECGIEIGHVAQVLRIRPTIIFAIEQGRFEQLPGPAYAVGFVRSYAAYLGLDAEGIVLRFKAEAAEMSGKPRLNFPLPISDSRVPTVPILVICVLLAVITYGAWYYLISGRDEIASLAPAVPDRLRQLLTPQPSPSRAGTNLDNPGQTPAQSDEPRAAPQDGMADSPAANVGTVAGSAAMAPATVAPAGGASPALPSPAAAPAPAPQSPTESSDGAPPVESRPGVPPPVVASVPPSPDVAQPAAEPGKSANASSFGAPDGEARVVLRAVADSWIQVRDNRSNLLFTRVLKPGEHYNVPNKSGLTLIAGNAGGLDIAVDGQAVPHIGDPGKVVRNVNLDPDRLLGMLQHAN